MMNITKKMVKEVTMGLLKSGFKGEITIYTGKRSLGKVSNLTELRARLYELASSKNYKTYSVDFGEGLVEVLNFNQEKLGRETVKTKDEIETMVENVKVKPNYILYVGQKKVDIIAEDSFDAILTSIEGLEILKGNEFAMNISKRINHKELEIQLDGGNCTLCQDIWIKNIYPVEQNKNIFKETANNQQLANRNKFLNRDNSVSVKTTPKKVVKNIKRDIIDSFNLEKKYKTIMELENDMNLDTEIKAHVIQFELLNNTKFKKREVEEITKKIINKVVDQVICNYYQNKIA